MFQDCVVRFIYIYDGNTFLVDCCFYYDLMSLFVPSNCFVLKSIFVRVHIAALVRTLLIIICPLYPFPFSYFSHLSIPF